MRGSPKALPRLVYEEPRFVDFFRAFTPVDELALLEIGSRPARRPESADFLGFARFPWVFAWTQNRTILPAWFGSGTALGSLVEAGQVDALRRPYARLPFFAHSWTHSR